MCVVVLHSTNTGSESLCDASSTKFLHISVSIFDGFSTSTLRDGFSTPTLCRFTSSWNANLSQLAYFTMMHDSRTRNLLHPFGVELADFAPQQGDVRQTPDTQSMSTVSCILPQRYVGPRMFASWHQWIFMFLQSMAGCCAFICFPTSCILLVNLFRNCVPPIRLFSEGEEFMNACRKYMYTCSC